MIIDWLLSNWLNGEALYRYKMLKAIDLARQPIWDFNKLESKTNGLRVIKRFERVNKVKFDPFNNDHLDLIYGNASNESFFRSMTHL